MNSRTWRNSYWPCFIEVSAHNVLSLLGQNPVLEKAKQKQRLPFSLLSPILIPFARYIMHVAERAPFLSEMKSFGGEFKLLLQNRTLL